jgi:hypothetical protein
MHRRMKAALAAVLAVAMSTIPAGCANPNYIGIQVYGYIVGNVVDQNGKAIPNALVTSTGTNTTARTGATGGYTIQTVAVGEQTVTATAAGYQPQATPITVVVVANQGVTAPNIVLVAVTSSS